MNIQHKTIQNNSVTIHYIVVNSEKGGIPVIMIPGAINSADEVLEAIKEYLSTYHIIISLRGRGKSSSPENGYTISDQASDILAVIESEKLDSIVLFGHSLGSTIAIKAASSIKEKVKGLIMGDFPPFYPPYNLEWAEHVNSFGDDIDISTKAVFGLANEAEYNDVSNELNILKCRILAIRASKDNTLLREEDADKLKEICPNCEVVLLNESGHELISDNPKGLSQVIEEFTSKLLL